MATVTAPTLLAEHVVRYSSDQPVPVADIIKSLQGLESIAGGYLPRAIYELTGAEVLDIQILVEGFAEGSLIEKTLVCLVFKNEESYLQFVGKVRSTVIERFQGSPKVIQGVAVSAVLAALVGAGIVALQASDSRSNPGGTITGDHNIVIQIGAEAYGMDPEAFAKVMAEVASKDRRRLAGNAAKVLAPARGPSGGGISIGDGEGEFIEVFSAETIAETPVVLEAEPVDFEASYTDVNLQIRATDRDSTSSGWAAVVPGIVDRRVRLLLDEGVSADTLADHASVRADITVTSRALGRGVPRPKSITVHAIIEDEEP